VWEEAGARLLAARTRPLHQPGTIHNLGSVITVSRLLMASLEAAVAPVLSWRRLWEGVAETCAAMAPGPRSSHAMAVVGDTVSGEDSGRAYRR
jgi:hypothetical protein